MAETVKRRPRRSMFLIPDALRGLLRSSISSEENPSPKPEVGKLLLTAGVAAGVVAAYMSFRSQQEGEDAVEELPGVVEAATESPELDKTVREAKPLNDIVRDVAPVKLPEPVKVPPKDPSFWQKTREAFRADPSQPAAKPPSPAAGAPASQVSKGMVGSAPSKLNDLPGGYRAKYQFSGFASAEGLTKYGSYTKEEADTIHYLKSGGAVTRAFSQVPPEIESLIRAFSRKHGVDEELALKIARIESGGNPNAISSTGALGVYQFTGGTATDFGVKNRFDPAQNIEAGVLLMKRNGKALTGADLPQTPVNIYLMLQLGVAGAKELLLAARDNKPVSALSDRLKSALGMNLGGKNAQTAAGYIESTRVALERTPRSSSTAVASSERAPAVGTSGVPTTSPVASGVPVPTESIAAVAATSADVKVRPVLSSVKKPVYSGDPTNVGAAPKHPPQQVIRTKNGTLVGL